MNEKLFSCFGVVYCSLNRLDIETAQYLREFLFALELAIEEDDGDLILNLIERIKTFVFPFFVSNNILVQNLAYKVFFLLRYVLIQDVQKI